MCLTIKIRFLHNFYVNEEQILLFVETLMSNYLRTDINCDVSRIENYKVLFFENAVFLLNLKKQLINNRYS